MNPPAFAQFLIGKTILDAQMTEEGLRIELDGGQSVTFSGFVFLGEFEKQTIQ